MKLIHQIGMRFFSFLKIRVLFSVLFFISSIPSHAQVLSVDSVVYFNDFESNRQEGEWLNLDTRSGNDSSHYALTSTAHPYGIGWSGAVPVGNGARTASVIIEMRLKSDHLRPDCKLVFTAAKDGQQLFWKSQDVSSKLTKQDQWIEVKSFEQVIPAMYTSADYTFSCYVWNNDNAAQVSIDDFKVKFELRPNVTFIPELVNEIKITAGSYNELYKGKYFSIQLDKANGEVQLLSAAGKLLWNHLWMYLKTHSITDHGSYFQHLKYEGDDISEEGRIFSFSYSDFSGSKLRLIVPVDGRSVKFRLSYICDKDISVDRLSLVLNSSLKVTHVYFSNGLELSQVVSPEYWLGNGGLTWESGADAWSVYHPEKISSIQLDNRSGACWMNADYTADHPMLQWPLEKKARNYKVDRSFSEWRKDDTIEVSFSISLHEKNCEVPRLMPFPSGYEAAFLFTEHADFTSLRSQRVLATGDDTTFIHQASSGFVGWKIPVTKSVFYFNPDKVRNDEKGGFSPGEICNVNGTTGFAELLDSLQQLGWEVALHTPEQFTSNREAVAMALDEMKKRFVLETWIDHGYDNGKSNNREDVVCDGLIKCNKNYIGDLLQNKGVKNIWNCYYEDSSFFGDVRFNDELIVPHPAFESAFPHPSMWNHTTLSGKATHFRTTSTLDLIDGSMWNYFLGNERLDFLIAHHGDYFAHVYPSRIDSTNGFYSWRQNVWSINDEFDKALQRLHQKSEEGKLWLPVVREFTEQFNALKSISYEWVDADRVMVTNRNAKEIKGLTFILRSDSFQVEGKKVNSKKSGDDTLFWFDLLPGESCELKITSGR